VKPDLLRRSFDPAQVPFETSDQHQLCAEAVLGQARAKEALEFGLAMKESGYHLFVAGPSHTGKTYLVRTFLEKLALEQPPPPDWVYVHNFREPDKPRALRLAPGGGRELAREMKLLVEGLKTQIPELFAGEEYSRRREDITSGFKKRRTEIFSNLDRQARDEGYVLRFEPTGIMVAPADEDGHPLDEKRIREMSEEEREELRRKSDQIQGKVTESLRQVAALEKELAEASKALDREMVLLAVGHMLDELLDKYAEQREVLIYLEQVREDIVGNFDRFQPKKEAAALPFAMPSETPEFREFEVNVLVDNSEAEGAPVVVEEHPTFPNLFGRIERQARLGTLVTDFTLLRGGALHQANGGFLVIPILELLKLGLPYEGLKRALRQKRVVMEDPIEQLGFMMTRTLQPEPIALDIKVVLVGDTHLYHLLMAYDPQFPKLFKVRAQMAGRMDWGREEVDSFINYLCGLVGGNSRLPLHRGAVARLVELAAELSEDRERLTLQLAIIKDMVTEAHHFAQKESHKAVMAQDVEAAINARRRRASMMEERLREAAVRGFINVETKGSAVGQINGLSVLSQGDYAFGQASRITASIGLGKEGVVAIDRESDLSGPFHTKGVLILSGFLLDRFAQDGALTLTASLVFEQSYSMVDGDSASLAELLTLISGLSDVPLRQDLAVTGSVSQQGQVQAIGGVNQKIEGFFRLCQARGLTGSQGVVIPKANLKNLMLHPDIVATAKKKKFTIYAVDTVEEALELFSGQKAGQPTKAGYTRGSIYDKVTKELKRLRELSRRKAASPKKAAKPKPRTRGGRK
jgi:lon-related putative ATP-dependent protease